MQNVEPVQMRQVRDFGQIITTTFTFYKQNWKPLFRAIAVICVPLALVGGFLAGGSVANIQQVSWKPGRDASELFGTMGKGMLGMIPGYLLLLFGVLLMVAIVHEYIRAYALNEHYVLGPMDLVKRGFSQLGSYFGVSFLLGLLSVIGFVLCVLPGFYVWTILSLALMAHAMERTGGTGSLSRSNALVKEDFWPTLGLVVVIGLINYLLNMVVQLPITIVSMVVGINTTMDTVQTGSSTGFPAWYGMFMSVALAVQWSVMMLTYPIVAVCMGLKYFSRIEETEGHSLHERISGFEQA